MYDFTVETCGRSYNLGKMSGDTWANVCTAIDQRQCGLRLSVQTSKVQRRSPIVAFGVDVCTASDQSQYSICTSFRTSTVQRRLSIAVLGGDICTVIDARSSRRRVGRIMPG
jgi:hypothetical protein